MDSSEIALNQNFLDQRTKKLGFRPQKEISYNRFLPYAAELDVESEQMLADIKANFGTSVMLREMQPGIDMWCLRLEKYIGLYGYKFSKEDHIVFIKVLFELLIIPNLEPMYMQIFSKTLILLLKKIKLISPDDLQLPWRPLYDLCQRVLSNSASVIGMYRYLSFRNHRTLRSLFKLLNATSKSSIGLNISMTLENYLSDLVHYANTYFPPEATQEMLDLFRPKLCPFDSDNFSDALEYCEWFLPTFARPDQANVSYELWFHEFMNIWDRCSNQMHWDEEMMALMTQLAESNIGYINWEPYLPAMFTRILRSLHLPVNYKQISTGLYPKISMDLIARWIVSVLGGGSSAQLYLNQLMKALESYFHPANFGRWISNLKELIKRLPACFIMRLHREKFRKIQWKTPIPDSHKLMEEDITNFVECMIPTVLQAMFSKMNISDVSSALQHLSILRPELIVPPVIDRFYVTLDSLTKPHKLTAAMNGVAAVARQLISGGDGAYPQGPTHVVPILFATLPGIDPNDVKKSFFTFQLISTFSIMVPFVDCSTASQYHDLTPEQELVCSSTAQFEDFFLQFMDRCFTLIESFALEVTRQEGKSAERRSRMEAGVEQGLASTFGSILYQTSNEIFTAALSKLKSFVTGCILEPKVAGKFLASICHTFTRVRPQETLNSLLPHLCNVILRLTESDEALKEEVLDNELLYNLLILQQISSAKCGAIVKHKDQLFQVLDRTLKLKCSDGYLLSCTLLANVLQGVVNVGPTEFRSTREDFTSKPISEFLPIKHWGKATSLFKLNINWSQPGAEERDFVESLTHRYLIPELNRINQYIDGDITLDKEELRQTMTIIFSNTVANPLLPFWKDEPPIVLKESCIPTASWKVKTGVAPMEVTMPNGDNVYQTVAKVALRLQSKLLESCEDDTQSFFVLIGIYDVLLFGLYRLKNEVDLLFRLYHTIKKLLDNRLSKEKGHLRSLMIERAAYQHRFRQIYSIPAFTETHRLILMSLITLSTSRYSQVRIMAQAKVFQVLDYYQYSYLTIIPELKSLLSLDTNKNHEQFKGSLHLLLGAKLRPLIAKQDWDLLYAIWPTVIQTIPSEKLSVIKLLDTLTEVVHKNFPTIAIKLEIPDDCVKAAAHLWKSSKPSPSKEMPSEEAIKNGLVKLNQLNEKNRQTYLALLNSLNDLISSRSLHWRFHGMALSFLRDLVHPDENYPPEVVQTFLNSLIHDQLQFRKIAIKCLIFVLKQQKRPRAQINIDPFEISGVDKMSAVIVPGNRPDNEWLTYCPENIPKNAEDWDKPRYVHKHYLGYYCWPKELKVAAPSKDQPSLDRNFNELNECEKKIYGFFSDPSCIEKLVNFLSLEEKKGKDKFDGLKFSLFKGLFRNHGDVHLDLFKPHLERLVVDKQESSQRCGAEIITGLIRGSIHWPYDKVAALWNWLQPTLRLALSNMTVETVGDWGVCFATSSEGRDPNKLHWLIELLLEDPLRQGEASFIICGRLTALQGVLNQQSWRVCYAYHQLLDIIKNYLTHEFQNVRDRIGSVLSNIFSTDLMLQDGSKSNAPEIESFLTEYISQVSVLTTYALQSDAVSESPMNVDKSGEGSSPTSGELSLVKNHCLNPILDEKQKDSKVRLFKTICKGTLSTVCLAPFPLRPVFMDLFPLLCVMENYEADEEMKKVCSALIAFLAKTSVPLNCIPHVLNAVEKVSTSGSWWAKLTSLDFAQVFIFHNMALINSNCDWVKQISDVVEKLLENERLEVREKAGEVLSGMLHCGFILDTNALLAKFKKICKTSLRKKSNHSINSGNNIDHNLIAKKHSGVLGLCAFIRASPYDIPEHLPEIILLLGDHLSDPQPIPATIRKTLGDFKRTHHDDWDTHKTKFTEDELLIISDLTIPPSYFA